MAGFEYLSTIPTVEADKFSTSAVCFDASEELLWAANASGFVGSYHSLQLLRYSSRYIQNSFIKQLLSINRGILSLSGEELKLVNRGGSIDFTIRDESSLYYMQCMCLNPNHDKTYISGENNLLTQVDLRSAKITKQASTECSNAVLRYSNKSGYVCCGTTTGKVTLHDPSTLQCINAIDAHSGSISDIDVSDNFLVTCGFSTRHSHLNCDRFLMMYDLRSMRALNPIQVHFDPTLLKFMPNYTSRLAVVSHTGQFQICEPGVPLTPSSLIVQQIESTGYPLAFDVSPSAQVFAFGDSEGYLHVWTNREDAMMNNFGQPTEFAADENRLPYLDINDPFVRLSTVPMDYTYDSSGRLLSDWSNELTEVKDRRLAPIDPKILESMKMNNFIGYAPAPVNYKRNQMPYTIRATNANELDDNIMDNNESDEEQDALSEYYGEIPKRYHRVAMKYSKLGLEDFNFESYNRTNFAGLETDIPNAYCNSMLQVLYFLRPMCIGLQNHSCDKEPCFACELGFLFRMLDYSKGQPCQANNFLRAFRAIPEAAGLGLILPDTEEAYKNANLAHLIQSWHLFVLQQLSRDTYKKDDKSEATDNDGAWFLKLYESKLEIITKCGCENKDVRTSSTLLYTLTYPSKSSQPNKDKQANSNEIETHSFCSVLLSSMSKTQNVFAWCERCQKYQPSTQTRLVKNLPDILAINCQVDNEEGIHFWKYQDMVAVWNNRKVTQEGDSAEEVPRRHWLPNKIQAQIVDDELVMNTIDSKKETEPEDESNIYYLFANICQIKNDYVGGNLIAHVRVGPEYHELKEGVRHTTWYLINDFSITPIPPVDSSSFSLDWQIPCILYFIKASVFQNFEGGVHLRDDPQIILADKSLNKNPEISTSSFVTPLEEDLPGKGDLVGLDTEFVSLNQDEAEIHSDGTRSTIKPSQMSVARISVIYGSGPKRGTAFIDDYISTSEQIYSGSNHSLLPTFSPQVVDYLTEFSGIRPGDLDPMVSTKYLTTLKASYRKLLCLIDRGVIFVGHGLRKDFRVINIKVPNEQVIDTVEIYHLERQRYLSLRFLAWYFLNRNIQTETHDSIEDAVTALDLYDKYTNTIKMGNFRQKLIACYETGRKCNWKAPTTT
ncbi:PAB-dependent poly(A)-specific ribonuclease subunit PAN2 [Trichoplax sp. H2]|nr:PAB-dependent poly(A)-specific ribonuclease subunit PAN2 [Trichoplax sp. H2]|eukprot:RDD45083.1 PAB-dependent poly(A)-specific ribonuclease subunit PAN2 [Trichoplax sp. H2]